ncbi:hypothetical protein B0H14DRAFT_2787984 [Mycena olivaceomarginata]|nr:hypothetical protein B0H14DRAFT_2787984 [Mycena olivaceomarginata]
MSVSPNATPPPRSPCRVTDDLLDLAQQITPSKQSRALREAACSPSKKPCSWLTTPCSRLKRTRTSYQPGTETREPFYSRLDAPILYSEWNGNKNVSHLFRNNLLLKIDASLIHGPSGAVGLPKLSRGCTASAAPYPVQSPTRPSWRSGCTLPIPPLPKSATRRQSTIAHATRTTFNTSSKLWQVTRLGLSTFSRIGIALCSPTQTVPTAPMDLLGVRSKKTTKIFSHLAQALTRPRSPRIHSSTSPPPRRLTPSQPSPQRAPAASSSRQEQENCESTSHGGHSRSPRRLQRHGEGQRRR